MTQTLGLEERLIDVDGGSVEVFVGGSGAIVTCQASPTGTPLPHPLAEFALSAGRIVAINPRGAGGSSPFDKATGPIRQLVTDADIVRQRLGIERWVLIGQSRGGFFALEYALRYPQAVAGLILTDTSSSWRFYLDLDSIYNNRRADFQQIQEIRSRALVADATVDDLKRWMSLTYHQPGAIERLAPQRISARNNPASIPGEVPDLRTAMLDELLGRSPHHEPWDVTDRLHEIVAPTLIIHGRFDNIIPPRWGELLHEHIANSELVLCESGHFAFDEEPDKIRMFIQRFIAERIAARN
jgi:proline iminopeptidase